MPSRRILKTPHFSLLIIRNTISKLQFCLFSYSRWGNKNPHPFVKFSKKKSQYKFSFLRRLHLGSVYIRLCTPGHCTIHTVQILPIPVSFRDLATKRRPRKYWSHSHVSTTTYTFFTKKLARGSPHFFYSLIRRDGVSTPLTSSQYFFSFSVWNRVRHKQEEWTASLAKYLVFFYIFGTF